MGYAGLRLGAIDPCEDPVPQIPEASDPFDSPWIRMGRAYEACNSRIEAIRAYHEAIASEPAGFAGHYLLGLDALREASWETAYQHFVAVIERAPAAWGGVSNLGVVYWFQRDVESALRCWERAMSLEVGAFAALSNLAVAHWVLGRASEALQCAERAVALGAADARAVNTLGSLLAESGNAHDALRCFEKAIARDGALAAPRLNLAVILEGRGQSRDAETVRRRARGLPEGLLTRHLGWALQLIEADAPGRRLPGEAEAGGDALARTWVLDPEEEGALE